MITEQDLQEAIAECNGKRHPDSGTCIKLAAFYIIQEHLYPKAEKMDDQAPVYSYAPAREPEETMIGDYGETEFLQSVFGKDAAQIWPIIDELVSTVQLLNPRLYSSFMERLQRP